MRQRLTVLQESHLLHSKAGSHAARKVVESSRRHKYLCIGSREGLVILLRRSGDMSGSGSRSAGQGVGAGCGCYDCCLGHKENASPRREAPVRRPRRKVLPSAQFVESESEP